MRFRNLLSGLAMAMAVLLPLGGASADMIANIKARGALTVGVKPDYPPFGYRDGSGQIVGLEVDLAQDLANRLGVPLKLMSVSASSRLQFLQQGAVDLILATTAVTRHRAHEVGLIEPRYYANGVGVLVRKDAGVASAGDLHDMTVCTMDAAYYNERLGGLAANINLLRLRHKGAAEEALRNGRCMALADEDVRLLYRKKSGPEKWADYQVVRLDFEPLPWAIAVKSDEKDSPFGKLIADAVTDWHRSGKLLELERKWLGENTKWLLEKHEELKQR
jgi:polar amino acid transport system substrate-binding protein